MNRIINQIIGNVVVIHGVIDASRSIRETMRLTDTILNKIDILCC